MEILVNPSLKLKFFLGLKIDNECKYLRKMLLRLKKL